MKKLQGLSAAILIAGLCVGASLSASAAVDITLNKDTFGTIPYDTFFAQTANPSAGQIADAIGATVDQVWKADYPSLALGSGYTIVYDPTDGTGKATITWNGDWYVDTTKPTYLIVKDGAYSEVDGIAYGGSYLWKLQGKWDGQGTITILDMFPGNGSAISHIELGGTAVPEPSTMIAGALLLLPFAASTVRALRRKREQV